MTDVTCAEPECNERPTTRATMRDAATGEVLVVEQVCDQHAAKLRTWSERGAR